MPELKAAKLAKLGKRWGLEYGEQDLEYLENLYEGITNTSGIVGALNEDQVLKLCKVSLIIENKIRANLEFDKDLKAYQNLVDHVDFRSKDFMVDVGMDLISDIVGLGATYSVKLLPRKKK